MRLVKTGQTPHELAEVHDVTHCATCGEPFEPKRHTMSWINCHCPEPDFTGHRVFICLRDGCSAQTLDPPCTGQHGPTADYGCG